MHFGAFSRTGKVGWFYYQTCRAIRPSFQYSKKHKSKYFKIRCQFQHSTACPNDMNHALELKEFTLKFFYLSSSDRPNVRFGPTVRPNFYRAVRPKWQNFFLQNTELFLYYIQWQWHPFHHYWSIGKIAKRMLTEPKLE